MRLPIHQVDAFTSRLFGGNPAAVVLLERWLPDDVMRAVAAENNLAETAFVLAGAAVGAGASSTAGAGTAPGTPASSTAGEAPIPLRWFSPTIEIDLCGHATLATGHVLFTHHLPRRDALLFTTKSGILSVTRREGLLELDLPARPGAPARVGEDLVAALGARPRQVLRARDLMAVFDDEDEVRALAPDFARVAALDAFGIIATAPGRDVDFVSRFFVPRAGIDEDPATGSSHCTLVPYWAGRLGRDRLSGRQLSARGGEFACERRGDRVGIAGGAVEYLRGEIELVEQPVSARSAGR
jgi:PhzF family phenazine biosynthesis protein